MGDMGDFYNDCRASAKARDKIREEKNMEIMRNWIMKNPENRSYIKNFGGTIGFRFPDKPKADFYPTKNKWRIGSVIYYGNMKKFLEWYERR